MKIPSELKYTESDEWIKIEGQTATIGVTDYAQDSLSDVVFFETVVSVGDEIAPKTQISTIESVKAAADVNSPISGKVIAVNEDLGGTPELVNTDPYGAAWMVKIALSNVSELNKLMDSAAYETYCAGRNH
jgi:glycine cleavage system H protein